MAASSPVITVLQKSQVSPPAAVVGDRSLSLSYFDFLWLRQPPIHYLFFYDLSITQTHFIETIVPSLKHSLKITLQHFFPFAGNLIVFHSSTKKPEIQYVEGDSVAVTFAECNLDFNQLTKNCPRDCELFYHLTPLLGKIDKTSDSTKIPLFSVQVTLFPNSGISIGMTNHHCLGDASARFCFLKAWTSIARSGSDESFLANGALPFYDRVVNNPKLEKSYLNFGNVETFNEFELPKLCGPSDKVRATFILSRTMLDSLKKLVSTEQPTLAYVSSFTITCAYIWSCIASTKEGDELQLFGFTIDCRARMNPPLPATYFGNCVGGCMAVEKTTKLKGKDGFVNAAKLIGENLHKTLTDKDGVVKEIESFGDFLSDGVPTTLIGVAGTPKLKFYDMDFGWGKPKKIETVSIDYSSSISLNASREKSEDVEIGVSLPTSEMETFVRAFENGLETYI
ncbi:hypothetical protein QVD17_33268 [Tagetes erecta]|uniref:Uncharacterized protein n=1 Tax=Tagetes erecta TaxID=13708 RepID=A0AAD8JYL6_TARER|nr:hypothetical protein QVD17_33268 [Tagetes erecta]